MENEKGRGNGSKRGFCEISSVWIKCLQVQVSILPALGFEIHVVSQQSKENVILILLREDVFCFFHVLRDLYCDFYSTLHINFITSEVFY